MIQLDVYEMRRTSIEVVPFDIEVDGEPVTGYTVAVKPVVAGDASDQPQPEPGDWKASKTDGSGTGPLVGAAGADFVLTEGLYLGYAKYTATPAVPILPVCYIRII